MHRWLMKTMRDSEAVPGRSRTEPAASGFEREQVRKWLQGQRKFRSDVAAYLVINAALVVVWLVTGAGYFWPGWIIAPWGLLIVLDLWETYLRKPLTDSDIDERLRRTHR